MFLNTLKTKTAELIKHIQRYDSLLIRITEDAVQRNIIAKGDRRYVGQIAKVCYCELTIIVLWNKKESREVILISLWAVHEKKTVMIRGLPNVKNIIRLNNTLYTSNDYNGTISWSKDRITNDTISYWRHPKSFWLLNRKTRYRENDKNTIKIRVVVNG